MCISQAQHITIEISKSDLKPPEAKLSELADEISYIKLETKPGILIGAANHYSVIQVSEGFLLYHRRYTQEILMFNQDGSFKTKVGRLCKGP